MYKVDVDNGKYTFINDNGILKILRYGAEWRDDVGDKALLSLLQYVEKLEQQINAHCE